jgi:mechanosensitive ion channel protein 1/2/3
MICTYSIFFVLCSGAMIAPSILAHLPQFWRGAAVVSLVWFLQRWKTNFLSSVVTNQVNVGLDREKLSAFDKVSSLGLIMIGVMGLAEACGIAVQSILTVGGVGGIVHLFNWFSSCYLRKPI